nr:hypothetical protein [Tanacetum cinerariifolium]
NGVNILKSIDEGPFKIGKFRETLAEGALHLGPEQDRVFVDLTPEENERFKADIRATNIRLQGLPKDIYTLINHYTYAKDIWDNVKMLLEGLKQSNYNQMYAYLKQHENVHGRQNRGRMNYVRGAVAATNMGVQNRAGNANPDLAWQIKCYNSQENGAVLDEEQLLFIAGGQTNTFNDDVDEEPTMFMANLLSADPIYDEAGPSYDSNILSEVKDHDNYVDSVDEYHEVHEMLNNVQPNYVVGSGVEYTSDSNIIPYEQYVNDNAEQAANLCIFCAK